MYQIIFLLLLVLCSSAAISCEIIMGYRTSARLPLIEAVPSNNGLYQAIYTRAAEQVQCTLKIKRAPKKRIIKMLKDGEIDFYPGYGFSPKRSQYFHFIENGLTSHSVIVTHNSITHVDSLDELNNKILLKPYGGRKSKVEKQNILIRYGQDLSIDDAVKVLEKKQADFFIYNKASIKYYLAKNPDADVKVHDCCFSSKPMYLGFSKRSQHYQAIKNESYHPKKAITINNLPYKMVESTKVSAFAKALQNLSNSGEIAKLEALYYSAALESEHPASSDISETKH